MPIDFDDDLDEMLSADDHGVSFTVGADATTYEGILNKPYIMQDGGYSGISSREPVLALKSSLAESLSIARGATIIIGGASYSVKVVEPDGSGLTILRLGR